MPSKSYISPRQMEEFRQFYRNHSLRLTKQRLEIFRALIESDKHPGAEGVFEQVRKKLPNISLDTVYRTLWGMEEAGVIAQVGLGNKARFDGHSEPHCHFVCVNCGEVYDIFPPKGSDMLHIPENIKKFGEVKNVNLQFRGICKSCLRAADDVKK